MATHEEAPGMIIHSDVAWDIASAYSYTLASDTRTLAGQIDRAIVAALEAERERCAAIAEKHLPHIPHDGPSDEYTHGYYMACGQIATAIREEKT